MGVGTDAGEHFPDDKGLFEVITRVQTDGLADRIPVRGSHDDRGVRPGELAVRGDEGAPVHDRRGEVQQDERRAPAAHLLQGGGAVGGGHNGMAGAFEGLDEEGADVLIVLDDEDGVDVRGPMSVVALAHTGVASDRSGRASGGPGGRLSRP